MLITRCDVCQPISTAVDEPFYRVVSGVSWVAVDYKPKKRTKAPNATLKRGLAHALSLTSTHTLRVLQIATGAKQETFRQM